MLAELGGDWPVLHRAAVLFNALHNLHVEANRLHQFFRYSEHVKQVFSPLRLIGVLYLIKLLLNALLAICRLICKIFHCTLLQLDVLSTFQKRLFNEKLNYVIKAVPILTEIKSFEFLLLILRSRRFRKGIQENFNQVQVFLSVNITQNNVNKFRLEHILNQPLSEQYSYDLK